MGTYIVHWTEEIWHRTIVEADSQEDATQKFWDNDIDWATDKIVGTEIQDSVVAELEVV
jgi:hypothetical protein